MDISFDLSASETLEAGSGADRGAWAPSWPRVGPAVALGAGFVLGAVCAVGVGGAGQQSPVSTASSAPSAPASAVTGLMTELLPGGSVYRSQVPSEPHTRAWTWAAYAPCGSIYRSQVPAGLSRIECRDPSQGSARSRGAGRL
jgi:hypothetical protein